MLRFLRKENAFHVWWGEIVANEPKLNYQVKSVDRALNILSAFNVNKSELSLTELSEAAELKKSTLFRLLDVLIINKFIEQNPLNDKYRLGIKAFEVGMVYYLTQLKINQIAKPLIVDLVNKVNFTVNLAICEGEEIVYVLIEEPNKIMRINFSIGARFYMHCTALGKIFLAHLSEDMVGKILKKAGLPKITEKTITSLEEFKDHLKVVRKQEYSEDKEEALEGLRCLAVPIYDYTGKVVAAMSISGTIFELNDKTVKENLTELKETARLISQKLGYQSNIIFDGI